MQKNKIEISKVGQGITMYLPLSVYRAGKSNLTISFPGVCSGDPDAFRFGTSPEQLDNFKCKLQELFAKYVEGKT
jgi:hypothetical protein